MTKASLKTNKIDANGLIFSVRNMNKMNSVNIVNILHKNNDNNNNYRIQLYSK